MKVCGLLYNAVFLLRLLVPFTRFRHRWILCFVCLAQYVFTHIQLRRGLGSSTDATLLAYHVPVGVLAYFLSCLTVGLFLGLRLETSWA